MILIRIQTVFDCFPESCMATDFQAECRHMPGDRFGVAEAGQAGPAVGGEVRPVCHDHKCLAGNLGQLTDRLQARQFLHPVPPALRQHGDQLQSHRLLDMSGLILVPAPDPAPSGPGMGPEGSVGSPDNQRRIVAQGAPRPRQPSARRGLAHPARAGQDHPVATSFCQSPMDA